FTFGAVDADGDALQCRVLDGVDELLPPAPCGSNETRTGTVTAIGTHALTLEVTDGKGGKDTRTASVEVASLPQVGDLRLSKVEWGQTVMSAAPRLVEGKDALIRVYVLSERTGITGVQVKIDATKNGT